MNMLSGLEQIAGYRLSKLELYNWGTFDGAVHGFHPRGEWTLLVGENGTGKSTIVDALLTLLVRPVTRKYNFASGASKSERDERTYIQGAYDKTIGASGTPQLRYLRPGSKHYSALLACFENASTGKVFTICQVLYLDSHNKPKKFYALDEQQERGIAEDLGNITESSSVLGTLKHRDFKATGSYTQYFEWLRRKVDCRPKAMDMFNQAAWVKDVNQLDTFVREQMLEKRPWDEKVSQLLTNFVELSEAHRSLVTVREQAKLLGPVTETGQRHQKLAEELNTARDQLASISLFFDSATVQLLEPLCYEWAGRVSQIETQSELLQGEIKNAHREVARIELEIAGAGGERLQRLPDLIEREEEREQTKKKARTQLELLLTQASIDMEIDSGEALRRLQAAASSRQQELEIERKLTQEQAAQLQYEIGHHKQRMHDDREELTSLEQRKGNMPRELVYMRDELCRELKIAPRELPFAAELMAVGAEHREWEATIEQVLNGFARDLLVKERHYAKVSGFIDSRRLVDRDGRGQRLSYTRVGVARSAPEHATAGDNISLLSMLKFREENDLAPWVRAQVAQRFDFKACESVEQFQTADQAAMTRNRHIKRNKIQHSKDDRSQQGDRKRFVLGWENREKIRALKDSLEQGEAALQQLAASESALMQAIEDATNALARLRQIAGFNEFDAIDDERHRLLAAEYRLELERLRKSNDKIRELEGRKNTVEAKIDNKQQLLKALSRECAEAATALDNGRQLTAKASQSLASARENGTYERLATQFGSIERMLTSTPLTLDNLTTLPGEFQQQRFDEVERLRNRLEPVAKSLRGQMLKFLTKFPAFQADLADDVDSLPQFVALHQRIEKDDLPRHVKRFKEKLNEKVLTEVGVMNSHLETEREEIIEKIEEINQGLRRMEWREGTHIRLDSGPTSDPEIRDFRRELAGCLTGYLDGSNQATEETFLRIQKLVDKLRDDKNVRWREKVIDVRRWFSFSARELVTETGEPRSYYDGGSGKSGGEKARLAFLVLVAAIVYQYDIDPDDPRSDKFRFVMVDEMFSRTAAKYAKYAMELFKQFGLQLMIVAPLDAKARVCEPYVGIHAHVVKDAETDRSEILSYTSQREASSLRNGKQSATAKRPKLK